MYVQRGQCLLLLLGTSPSNIRLSIISSRLLTSSTAVAVALLSSNIPGNLLPGVDALDFVETPLEDQKLSGEGGSPTDAQWETYWQEGGNDIVHDVWSILRDYETTWKDSVSPTNPSGFLGTSWHYAKALFRILFMNSPKKESRQGDEPKVTGDLASAVDTLEQAALYDDQDAIFLLAEMNFFGNFSYPRNHKEAFKRYARLAEIDGNRTAQHMLGLMYATGIGGSVERDQAKALLYHTFAAEQGDTRSELTVAFRHHASIGTPRDCEKASQYYKRVADKAMKYWKSGPPGGQVMSKNSYRWADETGGIYGEGASASSSGHNAPRDGLSAINVDDYLEYLYMRERQGDWGATYALGKHFYEGARGHRRNMKKAQKHFSKVARAYWDKTGKTNPKGPRGIDKIAAKSAAYLGRMALRGEGTEQNSQKAMDWFRRGIENGDPFCQYHMGMMYHDGIGVPKDDLKGSIFLKAAAEQDFAPAQSAMGILFLDQGDTDTAGRYFELAARHGFMEAFYYLAEMNNKGVGVERVCSTATAYYKIVAERAEVLHSSFSEANAAYEAGDLERALIASIMAAEQGYEVAQANVAYLLDKKTSVFSLPSFSSITRYFSTTGRSATSKSLLINADLALVYFTRSAKQHNTDSLVKTGDYYLAGLGRTAAMSGSSGIDEAAPSLIPDPDRASTVYTHAAESHHSAQALWNLGWMHENGVPGIVPQDFHMAKRYYDLALEMNKEAYLPVKIALAKLRLRSWWNGVSGGKIQGIKFDEDEAKGKKKWASFTEWIGHFLDAAEEMDREDEKREQAKTLSGDMDLDGIGGGDANDAMPGGDADRQHDVYYEDNELEFFIDDGLVESLIIIMLAATLAFLIYYRNQRALQARLAPPDPARMAMAHGANLPMEMGPPPPADGGAGQQGGGQGGAAAEQQRQGGVFPQPGEPEWGQWVAGGIGH